MRLGSFSVPVLGLALVYSFALPASAAIENLGVESDPLETWVDLVGDSATSSEVIASLNQQAAEEEVTVEEIAVRNLAELNVAMDVAQLKPAPEYTPSEPSMGTFSSGSGHSKQLPQPQRRADFFYYDSSTAGFNHGHLGMYRNFTNVVESANANLGVRLIKIANRKVPSGTYILKYDKSKKAERIAASDWAFSKVGADYRSWWSPNRKKGGPFNCSQLIWAAYNDATGDDLDANGGAYVMPMDVATASGVYYYNLV